MKKILAAAVVTAAIFVLPCASVSAEASVLAEGASGAVLISKNGSEKYPCGSLSKLMTVLIAADKIKSGELSADTVFTVSEHANSMQGAQIWLMPGDTISVDELLRGIIIGNANDAACALAEGIGGTEETFTAMMNAMAVSIGMNDTLYVNSSGYMSDGDHTTAEDTVKLLQKLAQFPFLTEIFTSRMEYIRNGDVQLVTSNPRAVRYNGALGFKCGFWEKENNRTYYSAEAAKRDGEIYLSAVLGADDEDECAEKAFSLLDKGFSAYETVTPQVPQELPRTLKVKNGISAEIGIEVKDTGKATVAAGTSDKITCRTALPEFVYAPVKRGDKVGELLYYYDDRYISAADITAVRSSEEKSFKYCMSNILKKIVSFE